jgi:mycothiol synthase
VTFHIEQIDTRTVPEKVLRAMHELYLEWDLEWTPNDPIVPWEQRLVDWRYLRDEVDVPRWVATEGSRVAAVAGVYHHRTEDLQNSFGWVFVSADDRRKGLGTEVLKRALDYGIADGRGRFLTNIPVHVGGHELALAAGMKMVYNERVSQLRIADVDRALMRSWIEGARERAVDYELLFMKSPTPDEYREQFVALTDVMNTAPLEDLEEEPHHLTVEELASMEAEDNLRGRDTMAYVAVHRPTGQFAGYTNVAYQSHHPAMATQLDTGVDPAHRNKGLGRWIKAAMVEKIMADYPLVEIIETENAESNEPMLNINVAMGFKPSLDLKVYQGDIRKVRALLK